MAFSKIVVSRAKNRPEVHYHQETNSAGNNYGCF